MVEAGAGTGKTGVMVDRYCRLVREQGLSPDSILAITFTDRAAAELRERIRARLGADLGGAWITTIHGFCNRLLAGHPVAAGIDPRFRVLDAPEAERAAREAFDDALEEFLADGEKRIASAPSPPSRSAACGRSSPASTPSCAAAARSGRGCRRRPSLTSGRRCGTRPRRRPRRLPS